MNAVAESLRQLKVRNYVRKASNGTYWFDFSVSKMRAMSEIFGNSFFLIVYGAKDVEGDYFVIPYANVKRVLTPASTANDSGDRSPRWVGNIVEEKLRITNSGERVDVSEYYGNRTLLEEAIGRREI